jgi:hypothetical protein
MSPVLETLDQLLGGDLPLAVVRELFETDVRLVQAVAAMLHTGEVRLYADGIEVPRWRWGEVLATACDQSSLAGARLAITEVGARRIG